jgi:hypothetical protein
MEVAMARSEISANKMRAYLEQAFLNNPYATEEIKAKAFSKIGNLESKEKMRSWQKGKGGEKDTLNLKEEFINIFEEAVRSMFEIAQISFRNFRQSVVEDSLIPTGAASGEEKIFTEMFNKIVNQKNKGVFRDSCGPDSTSLEKAKIGDREFHLCELQAKKPRVIVQYKVVKLHGKAKGVGAVTEVLDSIIKNLELNAEKLKRASKGNVKAFLEVMYSLDTNQGLFEKGCGIHSDFNKTVKVGDKEYSVCTVNPAPEDVKYVTKKQFTKGVGACPTCMIEDISNNHPGSLASLMNLVGIKNYSGNSLLGRRITKIR